MDDDSDSDYSPKKSQIKKQKALKYYQIEKRQIVYECQPLLTKHSDCDSNCLSFQKQSYQNQTIRKCKLMIEPLPLSYCKDFLQNIIILRENQKSLQFVKKAQHKSYTKKYKLYPKLTYFQRKQINLLQTSGYKNCIIAALFGVSTQQVRSNKFVMQMASQKEEIKLTNAEINWLTLQAQKESNSCLFNAASFRKAFINQFPQQNVSVHQFRKLLHQCQIRYRTPSLKPLSFFQKDGKNEETQQFISTLCGYLNENYKIIFIDECSLGNISKCSHKQWHVLGSFKQTTHRISCFKYMIGALGFNNFLYFQLFEGTGKAYIFQDFVTSIIYRVYSNATIINLMRSIQCTLTSLGLLDHFVVQNSFKVFVRTLRHINTQEGRINYTEREQQMYEQKVRYIQRKNALTQRKHYEQQENLGFQQIPIPPPVVAQDQLKQPEQTKKDATNRKGQRKQKLERQPQIIQQEISIQDNSQKLKLGIEELMGLADRGLSQISQLQRDYSFEQMNKYLDMNQLEEIYDNFQRVKAAIDENEITQENLMNFTNLNMLCYEELLELEESIRGKCKMAPAKEEVYKRREKDKAISNVKKRKADYYK